MHPSYDEIRWDLAQAYLCGGQPDSPTGEHTFLEQARELLDGIRQDEVSSGFQPFIKYNLLEPTCTISGSH